MAIKDWSTTAASNNAAVPNGWPEGMAISGVNDCGRQMMADIRLWYEDAQWINLGHTPTRVSGSQFTIPTDVTATYDVGRRVKMTGSSTAYGTISAVSYGAPNTTVTVAESSVPSTLSTVSVGIVSGTNSASPVSYLAQDGSVSAPPYSFSADTNTGMYRIGADNLGFAVNGTLVFDINGTRLTSSLPYYAADGSVSAPSLAFVNSTGMGFYRSAANQLSVATAGTERARIDASGNVAVGAIAPSEKFHVSGNTRVDGGGWTPVNNIGNSGTAFTIDCSLSNVHRVSMTGNVTTVTISNPHDGQTIIVRLKQDATGSRTITWPTAFKWAGGTAGVLTTAANATDRLTATYYSDTALWDCSLAKDIK